MSNGYNNFLFYKEWVQQIRLLACSDDPQDILTLCDGLEAFLDGEDPSGESMTLMATLVYNQMTAQIMRDKEQYEEISRKRSEAGKNGAEAKRSKRKQTEANASKSKQDEATASLKEEEEDDVEEDDDVSPSGDNTLSCIALPEPTFVAEADPKKLTDKALEDEFNALWMLYPRKAGKSDALRHYKKARKDGTTYDEVEQGIIRYARHIEDEKTDPQYIAMGSTWFCGHRWEDVYARNGPKAGSLEWLMSL